MPSHAILGSERQQEFKLALKSWLDKQPAKAKAFFRIGVHPSVVYKITNKGEGSIVSPSAMAKLWQETGDQAFLMTTAEQQIYRRTMGKKLRNLPWPSQAEWPTRESVLSKVPVQTPVKPVAQPPPEAVESLTSLEDLVALIKIIIRNLKRLSELSPNDPRRQEARRSLTRPAMELFRHAMALGLEFPEAFIDLLGQLDLVINAFPGGKKP